MPKKPLTPEQLQKDISIELVNQVQRIFPGIPEPYNNVDALYATVKALQIITDVLLRRRTFATTGSAILISDLSRLTRYYDNRYVSSGGEDVRLVTFGAIITDDAGDGTVEGDLNATDFTGHDYADGTSLQIATNNIVTFGHKAAAYMWVGPSPRTVGLGGSYTALSEDLINTGTADHAALTNRGQVDAHPQAAITDLLSDQTVQDNAIDANTTKNTAQDGRLDSLEAWDTDHVDPVGNPDPHSQYLLPEELPSTAVSYLSAQANGLDYSLLNTPPADPESGVSGTVNDADILVATFTHQTPLQQDLLYAELQTMVILDLEGQLQSTFVYPVAYLNHQGGGRTELGRGTPQELAETRATYHFQVQILGPLTAPAGDWTSVEVYGTKDGGGPDRTVTIYVDGTGASRNITYLPIPAYPAEHGTTHNNNGSDPIPDLQLISENFVFAAYLNFETPLNTAFPDLGAAWQPLDILTIEGATPRNIVNEGSGRFSFAYEGVYAFYLSGSFEHNISNSGRVTYVRVYNYTDSIAGSGMVIGTGRNAEATTIPAQTIVTISASDVGKVFGVEIGDGDTYTAVNFQACGLGIHNIGEWRTP